MDCWHRDCSWRKGRPRMSRICVSSLWVREKPPVGGWHRVLMFHGVPLLCRPPHPGCQMGKQL